MRGERGNALVLNGLLIEGAVTVGAGSLAKLSIKHCTLVPGLPTVTLAPEFVLISSVSQSATDPRPAAAPTSATSKPTAHTRNTTRPTIACKPDTKVRGARLTRAG